MTNPYAQVALTYVRRSLSSWQSIVMMLTWLSLTAILVLILNVRDPSDSGAVPSLFLPIVLGSVFLSGNLAYHISEQLVGLQSRLLPNFRRVHLIVACVAVTLVAIVLPALLSILLRLHSVGLVAISLLSFGLIFLLMFSQSAWLSVTLMLIGNASFIGVCLAWNTITRLCSGELEPVALAMLGLGIAAVLYGGFQAFHIDEDSLNFQMQMIQAEWRKGRMPLAFQTTATSSPSDWRENLIASQTTGLVQHAQQAAISPWSRICRWRAGMPPDWSIPLVALGLCGFWYVVSRFVLGKWSGESILMMSVAFCTFLPAIWPWAAVRMRRTLWAQYESLLPIDRRSYVRQSGLLVAVSQFQYWLICVIVLVLFQQVVFPGCLGLLMKLLACSFLCQIGVFGVAASLLRLQSSDLRGWGFVAAIGIGMFASMFFSTFADSQKQGTVIPNSLFWATGGFAAMGLLLAWDAYRRWLVTDFD